MPLVQYLVKKEFLMHIKHHRCSPLLGGWSVLGDSYMVCHLGVVFVPCYKDVYCCPYCIWMFPVVPEKCDWRVRARLKTFPFLLWVWTRTMQKMLPGDRQKMKRPQALALPLATSWAHVSQCGSRHPCILSQSHEHYILKTASISKRKTSAGLGGPWL